MGVRSEAAARIGRFGVQMVEHRRQFHLVRVLQDDIVRFLAPQEPADDDLVVQPPHDEFANA